VSERRVQQVMGRIFVGNPVPQAILFLLENNVSHSLK
jgi:hypothetical protein